jgi:hypothetical protein
MKANGCRPAGITTLLLFCAAACGLAPTPRPQPVAAYPRIAPPARSADGPIVTEKITLLLDAADPEAAAERAAEGAALFEGYETGRSGWETIGGQAVSQTLFIPQPRSEDFRSWLLNLGPAQSESRSGRPCPGGWTEFAVTYYPVRSGLAGDGPGPGTSFYGPGRKAVLLLSQVSAAILLAVCIVLPLGLMVVGAAATVRWLLENRGG